MWKYEGKEVPKPNEIHYEFTGQILPTYTSDGWIKLMLQPRGTGNKNFGDLAIEISDTRFKSLTGALEAINKRSFAINRDYIAWLNNLHLKLNGESELVIKEVEGKFYIALAITSDKSLNNRISENLFDTEEDAELAIMNGTWKLMGIIENKPNYRDSKRLVVMKLGDKFTVGRFDNGEYVPDSLQKKHEFDSLELANSYLDAFLGTVY